MDINALKNMVFGAWKSLCENKEMLDGLNVFPIPDGDTGTNMEKTVLGAIQVFSDMDTRNLEYDDLGAVYDGILMAAQGNSGVILSQWFKGLFTSLERSGELNALSLNDAFMEASESAYNAVSTPVEGTFLTVAREAYEYAEEYLSEETEVEDYLKCALTGAEESLKRTPELLPVLKEAGVVDSGGYGLVCVLSGMIKAMSGDDSLEKELYSGKLKASLKGTAETEEFGYCTELILKLGGDKADKFEQAELSSFLERSGNSVICVRDGDRIKIHVHTLKPEDILTYCHRYGEFLKIKIDNMTQQHRELNDKFSEPAERKKEYCAIIAVADGDGVEKLFRSMGAKQIIRGGQSDNVSTERILEAFREANAENIIFLPDNKNLFLVAEQAKNLFTQSDVKIIHTSSMAEGYAALSMIDPQGAPETIIETMNGAIKNTVTCCIARATRASVNNGIVIADGQYIGTANDNIVYAADKIEDAVMGTLRAVKSIEEKESVLVMCAGEKRTAEGERMGGEIRKICSQAEVYFINGEQEVFDYVFAIE